MYSDKDKRRFLLVINNLQKRFLEEKPINLDQLETISNGGEIEINITYAGDKPFEFVETVKINDVEISVLRVQIPLMHRNEFAGVLSSKFNLLKDNFVLEDEFDEEFNEIGKKFSKEKRMQGSNLKSRVLIPYFDSEDNRIFKCLQFYNPPEYRKNERPGFKVFRTTFRSKVYVPQGIPKGTYVLVAGEKKKD